MTTKQYILFYTIFFAINLVAVIACYADKDAARRGDRRIAGSTLLLLALVGGTPGSIIAQHKFRHKTQKQPFKFQLYSIAIIQAIFLIAMCLPNVRQFFMAILEDWIHP